MPQQVEIIGNFGIQIISASPQKMVKNKKLPIVNAHHSSIALVPPIGGLMHNFFGVLAFDSGARAM